VANDFQIPIEIGARGHGIVYEPRALAFEQSAMLWQEEFQRKVRIIVRGLSGLWKLRAKITGFRRWQFVSHKLLRWAVGPILVVTLVSNAVLMRESVFYTLTMMGQLFVYLAALNGWRMRKTRKSHPLFYLPFYFTMVNLAAVVAFSKFLAGERRSVWEKAESARMVPAASPGHNVVTALRPRVAREARLTPRKMEATGIAGKVAKS
jgi:hypothetical protein